MSKPLTQIEVINHKKVAIKALNSLLEKYINSGDTSLLKKADLISYWVESFSNYVDFESKFDSSRLIRYSRGDVIRVNFGFNIGKELGGLHLAVVLDNDNKQSADVITVLPLSSSSGKTIHERSVDLGTELYTKITSVQDKLILDLKAEMEELKRIYYALQLALQESDNEKDALSNPIELQKELDGKIKSLNETLIRAEKNRFEISKLKSGSMAVTNQITTVSKQRIYTPKKSEDFLYGISLSTTAMEKINRKILELYTR